MIFLLITFDRLMKTFVNTRY